MGYYVEVPKHHDKAEQIRDLFGGKIVDLKVASEAISDPTKGVIVVIDNGPFEAAGFAYNQQEFEEFTSRSDLRPKKYVILSRQKAEELTRYN